MRISEIIERFGRTVFEAPFGAMAQTIGDSPEVAEIRIAVLDDVKKKIQRAGGKALFPYNLVRIGIRASSHDAAVVERDFFRKFFRGRSAQGPVERNVPLSGGPTRRDPGVRGRSTALAVDRDVG